MTRLSNYIWNSVKAILPKALKKTIRDQLRIYQYISSLKTLSKNEDLGRFILMATPEHGNLGDHAIAEAEHVFLKAYFSEKQVIEITGDCYRLMKDTIKTRITAEDVLCICGGGFLGSLWMNEEELVRDILLTFPDNKIIVFPQTVFFDENHYGNTQLRKSKEVFSSHNKILFAVRDKNSIATAKQILGEDSNSSIVFVPDIVTCLQGSHYRTNKPKQRVGLLACMRQDKEKVVTQEITQMIESIASHNGFTLCYTDTVIHKKIRPNMRKNLLKQKLDEFANAQFVITDRLHGMLFAAITGTPCVALNNASGKVTGVYEWIKDLEYIKLANNMCELHSFASRINFSKQFHYSNEKLKPVFDMFAEKIKEFCEE